MAVTRRYFDRTPGAEGDPGEVTRIINNYTIGNDELTSELLGRVEVLEANTSRAAGVVEGALGAVEVDMAVADSWLIASTSGDFTVNPVNFRASRVDVLYVTVYITTTGHEMTFGPSHRYVGLKPSETTWTGGQKRTFRFTYLPNVDEWIGEELSAQLGLNVAAVELDDATAAVPDTSTPTPTAPFTAGVYRFDNGVYTSGGITADETSVGSGAASADVNVYLAVVDTADGDAYDNRVSAVRWFVDPIDTTFTTWASTTPAIGENGYAGASTVAPWKFEFDCSTDPTGQMDPSWAYDNPHDIYAQVLFTNTFVTSVKVDLTVDNNVSLPPAPTAPTSVSATAGVNKIDLAWTAPTPSGSGTATITDGTDPTALTVGWQSATIPIPQTTVAGDVVVMAVQVVNKNTSPTITVPAGWVQLGTTKGSTTTQEWQAVYRYVATGATTNPTVEVVSANIGGYAIVLTGVDPTAITDATVVEGTTATPAGITTATNGAFVVQMVCTGGINELAVDTANGFTQVAGGADFDTSQGNDWSCGAAVKLQATAGAVTAPTWAQGVAGGSYFAWHTIAFKPSVTSGATTATGYEVRSGTTSPPTGAVVDVGNVTAYSVTGLTPSVLRYAQVRAYDTIGQRGPWSSVVSATPTGTVTPPPPTSGRTVDFWSVTGLGTKQNFTVFSRPLNENGVYLPRPAIRANSSKDSPAGLATFFQNQIASTLSNYETVKASAKGFLGTDPGPRANCTFQLSWTGTTAAPPNNHVTTLLDLARTARGDYSASYRAAANAIKNATDGGYDWVERLVLTPAHEANGAWYASYFGVQSELVGVASLVNASNAEWGADIAGALRSAGADGDRGPLWVLAWKKVVDVFRAVDSRFWISLNLSSDSANPNGTSGSSAWNDDAIAGISGYFDSIDIDIYGREDAIPKYKGSGDINNPDNWTATKTEGTLAEAAAIADTYGVPVGFGEMAAQFWLPGVTGTKKMCTDQEAAIWYRKTLAWYDARPSHLAYLWQQSSTQAKPTGTTYIPNQTDHPKTWAVLKEYFPS